MSCGWEIDGHLPSCGCLTVVTSCNDGCKQNQVEALEHELADAKLAVESAQLVSSTLQASQKENDKLRSKLRVLIDANGKLKAQLNGAVKKYRKADDEAVKAAIAEFEEGIED